MQSSYTIDQLRERLAPVFRGNRVRRAILFGSYAQGRASAGSDVDLLVDSGLRGLAFFGLLESVASALDTPVDLIDTTQVERGSPIEREMLSSGVSIYER